MEINNNNKKQCDICKESANNLCLKCMNYYCDICYKFVHGKKANNQHKKEKIDYFNPIDTKCSSHPNHAVDLFCLDEKGKYIYKFFQLTIELCCPFCYYKNLHSGHKLIDIYNEELLKKENLTIEASTKEFNEIIQKTINLKEKIEKEIIEIDKLYDKVNTEVTKSFEIKHEKLTKEENDLKEKLQNEVTKIKEKLEYFLSESNQSIKTSENINKGIKVLEKEEEKNMIKILSYISKINKNQKQMKKLFQELMKNIKISFQEEKSDIIFEEYYFNGMYIPQDIELSNIGSNSLKVSWKLENIKLINIDNNKIKYRLEIRNENENEKFVKYYEGSEINCNIEKLNKNTNYEIRICSVYNDLISFWSEIQKFKTKDVDSIILNESKRGNEFLNKIYEYSGYKRMELLYRGTRDGSTSKKFHEKCDNQGPTICLYKNEKGNIFGGYADISWTTDGNNHSASNCFIFTLTNIHGTEPTKFPNSDTRYSIYHHISDGPTFGACNDIDINSDFLNSNSSSDFPCRYKDILGKGKSIFTGDFNNSNSSFKVIEIEVFKVFK